MCSPIYHILVDQLFCAVSQLDLLPCTNSGLCLSPEQSECARIQPLQKCTCKGVQTILTTFEICVTNKMSFFYAISLYLGLFPVNIAPCFLQVTRGGGTPSTIHSSTAGWSMCTETVGGPSLIVGATEETLFLLNVTLVKV